MPVPRPKAGARTRARFNKAKEAKKQAGNEEFELIGSPNEDKNAWKSCHAWRRKDHSNATQHPCFGHGHAHGHDFQTAPSRGLPHATGSAGGQLIA